LKIYSYLQTSVGKTSGTNTVPTSMEVAFSAGYGLIFFGLMLKSSISS